MTYNNGFWTADSLPVFHSLKKTGGKKMVDWKSEESGLNEGGEWFKPKQGMSQLVFLDDGSMVKGKDFQGREVDKVKFLVSVDKKPLFWEVQKAVNKSSLYGQIVKFAVLKGGLAGQLVLLNVVGEKKDRRYSLIDPAAVMGTGGGK